MLKMPTPDGFRMCPASRMWAHCASALGADHVLQVTDACELSPPKTNLKRMNNGKNGCNVPKRRLKLDPASIQYNLDLNQNKRRK